MGVEGTRRRRDWGTRRRRERDVMARLGDLRGVMNVMDVIAWRGDAQA
jgi:hypothetical protein